MKFTKHALLVILALSLLASCGETGTASDTTAQPDSTDTTAAVTEPQIVTDDLPDDLDFNGDTIYLAIDDYMGAILPDMYAEEETGNRLSDAVYNVIIGVEDRLNVNLEYTYDAPNRDIFASKLIQSITAGDDTVDIAFDIVNYSDKMANSTYFVNLADLKYIDLDKPWYNQTVRENVYSDYIHFVTGGFSLANTKNTFAIYVNQDLYSALGKTEDLYALVDSGKWTFDAMTGLLKDTYADLNGNTEKDPDDRFGMTFGDHNKFLGFNVALGGRVFEKNGDGYDFVFGSERMVDIVQAMCKLNNENENVLTAKPNLEGNDDYQLSAGGGCYMSKPFIEGRAMMSCSLVADAGAIIPAIDFSYGLLPYPKWDETQAEYKTFLQRSLYALVPVTCGDTDAASAVLEAFSSSYYYTVIPEYCEVSLKVRYSQDDDVARMFDLIRSSVTYDAGEIYGLLIGAPTGDFREQIMQNKPDWASYVAGKKNSWIDKMEKIAPVN
ncbi:MAG: hypothetical protein E7632_12695 [Ruminococcaceae bacterium]|nr:hypothetical protein [Oscillospiraceae bacterium]